MQTSFRDNVLSKNRLLLNLTLLWAMGTTIALMVLTVLCAYVMVHKETHWLPVCTGSEFSIGESAYSPAYLKEMTLKVADLRLTYSTSTIESRYAMLLELVPSNHQEAFKRLLDSERETVAAKNISSVFYAEKVTVDVKKAKGLVQGLLHRASHGLQLNPEHKTYQFQFSFRNGLLGLESIKEVADATQH